MKLSRFVPAKVRSGLTAVFRHEAPLAKDLRKARARLDVLLGDSQGPLKTFTEEKLLNPSGSYPRVPGPTNWQVLDIKNVSENRADVELAIWVAEHREVSKELEASVRAILKDRGLKVEVGNGSGYFELVRPPPGSRVVGLRGHVTLYASPSSRP